MQTDNNNNYKKRFSDPNTRTLFRIISVPGIVFLMLFPDSRFCTFLAAILFSAAAISDYLDGYFARRRGLVTDFGKFMDPMADKLLVSSAFIMLASYGWVPAWMVCIIICREFAVTGLRSIISQNKEDVSASNLGKYKTGFQIAAIIPLIFHYSYFGIDLNAIGTFFLWGALVFTIWSGVDYFVRFKRYLKI